MTDYKTLYEQASALDHDELVQLLVMSQSNSVPKNLYDSMEAHLKGENNLLKKKLAEAEEFKKNAEETCEGYAVTDSLMKQIERKDLDIKNIYEHHEKELKVALDLQKLLKEEIEHLKEEKEELEEQMEQMYDEQGIRDNLDMLGLVDEIDHEEEIEQLKEQIQQLKIEINDNN